MNKKKYSRANRTPSHKYFDGSELVTWLSENPEVITSLLGSTGNLVNTVTAKDPNQKALEEVIGLPQQYRYDFGGVTGIIGTGAGLVSNAVEKAKGIDTTQQQDEVKAFGNQEVTFASNEDLLNNWGGKRPLNNVTRKDVTGKSLFSEIVGGVADSFGAGVKGGLATAQVAPDPLAIGIGTVGSYLGTLGANIAGFFKTKKNVQNLNDSINAANARVDASYENAKENLDKQMMANMLANYAADGGRIYIKPSKRGTFTAAASKRGMGVQEFASKVLANKEDYSPAMVKKANFARNAARWHADGGFLRSDNFDNGVILIDQGGTHENNPHEGVQMGIAPDGKPNLVEEGEAIYMDYVFSNRLKVPKEVRNKYKLRGPKDMTFAEAFRKAQKESEERENDPISQNGLDNIAMILARTQEAVRGAEKATRMAALGGHLFATDGYMTIDRNKGTKEYFDALYADDSDYTKAIAYLEAHPEERDALIADIMAGKYDTATEKRNNVTVNANNWKRFATDRLKGPVHNAVLSYAQRMNQQPAPQTVLEVAQDAAATELPEVANRPVTKTVLDNTESKIGWEGSDPDEDMSSVNGKVSSRKSGTERTGNLGADWLRYMNPLTNAGLVLSDAMGLTNTPTRFNYIPGFQSVGFTPLGDYIPVTHFDTRYAANQAAQQASATRDAIMQSSSPNRWANLLAADYNAQLANGELYRQGALQDYERMLKAKEFNRGTNQYNSEMGFKTNVTNVDNRLRYAQAALQQAKMNDDASTLASSARAKNIGTLSESLSNMGRESFDLDRLDMLIDSGVFGTLSKKPYWWSDDRWNTYQTTTNAAKGGKLRKKKKGLTY